MRYVSPAKLVALSILASTAMFGQFTISNYQQVSQSVGSTTTTYAFTAQVTNTSVAVGGVTATAASSNPFNLRLVPSANVLTFGPVAANGTATSTNSFSVIIPNGTAFSSTNIGWTFTSTPVGPVANAGPNQSATPGQTVTLNGGGSTNPSGQGTLTYQWAFVSRPPGSSTVLQNQQNVISSFLVDVTGTFVVQLTVSNGSESSSATVSVNSSTDTAPVANAGPNQTVTTLPATITLNGTASSDTDGKQLTYSWSLTTVPTGSAATLSSTTAASPTFVADKDGTYVATLVVNDGILNSKASTVTISDNTPPVANAGPNQTMVPIGSTVTLNGSGSTDLDGDKLTYSWSLLSSPGGSKATLSSTLVNPTFTADLPGTYTAQLIVYDNLVPSTPATVQITTNQPLPPVANAGPNQSVGAPATVTLNGSGSTDPQNLQLTYSWSFITVPTGSKASLTGATTATPTFLADLPGTYVVQLIVSDGYGSSNPGSNVTISSSAQVPTANPGTAQTVAVGATVTLNGSASSDPQNATPLTYSWSLISAPANSLAVLKNSTTATPTFAADMQGAYVAQLIVTDTLNLTSSPATVMITATSVPSIILQSGVQVSVGGQATVNLSLSAASNSSLFVNVTSSNTSNVTVGTSTYVIPANSTAPVAVKVNGIGFGSATITATASGYVTATTTVVSTDIATFSPNAVTISGETTNRAASYLFLSSAAQNATTFNLTSSNPSVATVPATVVINAGSSSANVAVTSVSGGTAVITATPSSASLGIAAATLAVTVNAVEVTTTQLPAAIIGAPYLTVTSQPVQLTAANGTAPYTWKLAPGSTLPPNLTLSSSGVIGGSPATTSSPSITPITFIVTDSSSPAQTASATISVQVVAGTPHTITTNTGTTPQSTADTTAFATPLAVTVTDVNNFLVPNVVVTFAITANATSGASGTFPGAAPSATATTNSAGVATAPALTANSTLGSFTVTASVPPVASPNTQPPPVTFNLTNVVGVPATIAATGGTPQNTTEQTAFANPLVVLVKDAGGNPVPSAVVTFTAPSSTGATATFTGGATATTNTQGVATSNPVVAGPIAGAYSVTAATGAATGASFALTNNVGQAATLTVAPTTASIGINQNFPPLVATVKDSGGNGVSGIPINFVATAGSFGQTATFAPNPATTGTNGSVTVTATANSKAGPAYSVLASATGGSNPTTTFTLTNVSGPAASIMVNGGTSPQIVADGAAFAPLSVFVTDAGQNPVNNQSVTFTIATPQPGSASATFAGGLLTTTVSTNASGIATTASILTANNVVGGPYTVTATVTGSSPVLSTSFSLTNKVGPPTTIVVNGTVPPSVAINTAFGALIVKVTDQGGNLVPNASVTFTAPTTAASGTFTGPANTSVVSTLSTGLATAATYTANSIAGADTVTASTPGATGTISTNILLTNLAGPVATLAVNGGNNQITGINTQFTLPLSVLAKDAGGNVVPSAPITFSAPTTGASAGFPTVTTTTATTGSTGIATTSVAPTANGTPGMNYTVTATVTGSNPVVSISFTMTNNPGPPASITPGTGSGQSTVVATAFGQALQVTVKDAAGDLLPGINVTFTAVAGSTGASGLFGTSASTTAQTNSLGVATATPTANTKTGGFTVQVTATPGNAPAATFTLTNTFGTAAAITASATGTPQNVGITKSFANPLLVTVADQYGNAVSGATVVFTAPTPGPQVATATLSTPAATNASGQTSVTATAGSVAGAYSVTATITGVTGVSATFALTNNAGAAANIVITSGNGQTAPIQTIYANPLVVTVTDAGGNLVPSTQVTFTAPSSATNPTGAFGGFATSIVVTNANGVATSGVITANKITGTFQVTATTLSGATLATPFSLTNMPGLPATITVNPGTTPQSAQVTQPFANPLAVTVKDSQGNLVSNTVQVMFTAPSSGATGTFSTGATFTVNTVNGIATAPFTAGSVSSATAYTVSAIPTTGTATAVSFSLTNTSGPAASVAISSGSPQSMTVNIGTATTSKYGALAVIVKDAQGNLVASGTPVQFAAPTVGAGVATGLFGSNATITETTNTSGIATVPANTLIAGTVAGTFNLTVTAGTGTLQFPLKNTPGPAFSVAATSGGGQTATVKQAFSNPFVATVSDANGNPVNGVTVTFAAPTSGASGTFATSNSVTTNASGVATSNVYTANGVASSSTYSVTASVSGVSTPATFTTLTNQAGPPNSITPVASTNGQSVSVGQPFAPLAVTVTDVGGNFVSGATVTFTAPAQTGASGTFAGGVNTALTNASGVATSNVYTANTVTGTNTVTATATGGTNPSTTFALTNKPGAAYQIVTTSGNNQTPQISHTFTLSATVQDQYGNTVTSPATIVSFTATANPTTGASVVSTQAAQTVNGVATVTMTANTKIGAYTVAASANGTSLLPATFNITNLTGPPANLTIVSGNSQIATVGALYAAPLVVSVTDLGGNPVQGAQVTFSAPANGASGTFPAAALTGSNGQTQINFTANTAAGTVSVSATVPNGSGGTVTLSPSFSLTNKAGAVASIAATGGGGQSAYPNTEFASKLQAVVKDQYGNVITGQTVIFTNATTSAKAIFGDDPTGSTSTAVSGSNGVATSLPVTAGLINGTYTVTANTYPTTVSPGASYTLTNSTGDPAPTNTITMTAAPGSTLNVGQNMMIPIQITVTPQPQSQVQLTATTDGVNLLLGASSAVQTEQVPVPGSSNPASSISVDIYVQALSNTGSFPITFDMPGYTSFTGTVTVVPGGFILVDTGAGDGVPPTITQFSTYVGATTGLTVYPVQSNSSGSFTTPYTLGTIRGGITSPITVPLTVTGGSPLPGTVTSATFAADSQSANVTFTGANVGGGTITLPTSAVSGFSTAGSYQTLGVTVAAESIVANNVTIGNNLETSTTFSLDGVAPACPGGPGYDEFTVTASSSLIQLSTTLGGATSQSIQVPVVCGQSGSVPFYLQVVGGTVGQSGLSYTVSGQGFPSSTATVTVGNSGFAIAYDQGTPSSGQYFRVTAGEQINNTLTVYSYLLDSMGNPLTQQVLASTYNAAGVSITLTSDNTSIGTVASPVTIAPGTGSANTTFNPIEGPTATQLTNGITYVTANVSITKPSGFTAANDATIQAQVNDPGFLVSCAGPLGQFLQTNCSVSVGPILSSSLQVQIQANGNILLSTTGTDSGSSSITVTIPAGTNQGPVFFAYGLGSGSTATVTASAVPGQPGTSYNPSTSAAFSLVNSGVAIAGNFSNGFGQELLTSATDSAPYLQPPFTVEVGILNSDGSFGGEQAVMGQSSVSVNLNLNGAGTLGATQATIGAGQAQASVSYTPPSTVPSPNTATISLTGSPSGVSGTSSQNSLEVVIEQ